MRQWQRAIEARLGDRADLGTDGLHRQFWSRLPADDVRAALELFEVEACLRPGLLRPGDLLSEIFAPPATKNPLRWLEYQVRSGDGKVEILYQLSKRRKRHRTADEWCDNISTIDDFIRAWCGDHRTHRSSS
jgi:hypothetical protein